MRGVSGAGEVKFEGGVRKDGRLKDEGGYGILISNQRTFCIRLKKSAIDWEIVLFWCGWYKAQKIEEGSFLCD